MEIKRKVKWCCGSEGYSLHILITARYNYRITCAIKALFCAARNPNHKPYYLRSLRAAQACIAREIEQMNCAEGASSDLNGLAKWEAQQ
jgi:hypothetical protein